MLLLLEAVVQQLFVQTTMCFVPWEAVNHQHPFVQQWLLVLLDKSFVLTHLNALSLPLVPHRHDIALQLPHL
jgi:hypothetical protein